MLYTIYSAENKTLSIFLANFDTSDEKAVNKVSNIINTISNENSLHSFTVEIHETKK